MLALGGAVLPRQTQGDYLPLIPANIQGSLGLTATHDAVCGSSLMHPVSLSPVPTSGGETSYCLRKAMELEVTATSFSQLTTNCSRLTRHFISPVSF